jgi:LysM repeat protein
MNAFGCRILGSMMLFASLGGCAGVIMHPKVVAKPSNTPVEVRTVSAPTPVVVAKTATVVAAKSTVAVAATPESEFWADLVAARRFTDCSYDAAIESWAQRLTQSPANFNANLARIQPYLDYVWRRTQVLQMPSEVAFLPLVESDYRQVYGSYGSPGGWWQLMPETARGYRMDVSRGNDERIDPIKSTDVALKLMQENAERFDQDWLLAIFAYNAGGQRVERMLSAKGIKPGQVEHVRQLGLSLTTENHLHRLIAWGCIFANPARYQVTLPEPLLPSQRLTEVRLAHTTPVAAIVATLDNFGPEWKSQHPLIAKAGEIRYAQSVLAPKQTNAELAAMGNLQRFKSAAPVLAAVSQPKPQAVIANHARQQTHASNARINSTRVNSIVAAPASFKVRNGDNLWTIARRFDMRVNEILALNPSVSRDTVLKLGHVLRLK